MRLSIIVLRKPLQKQGRGRERVALFKSLITRNRKDAVEARLQKIKLKMSADMIEMLFCLRNVKFRFKKIYISNCL